jgi:hypothetical protein
MLIVPGYETGCQDKRTFRRCAMTRLASPRRWWARSESDQVHHPEDRSTDTTTTDRRHGTVDDRDVGYEHDTKIEEATEKAAEAIRDAAARAAADRAHARARTSALASIALVLGVAAALIVATGVLAIIGVGVGVLALLFAIGGLSATGRRYLFIAGRGEALVGLLLATAAIVVGILAITGVLPGLDTDTNVVEQLNDWLPGWLS